MEDEFFNSILYLVRKCMEKSTAIPNATLKTRTVLGLKFTPKYPMIPAVNNKGIKLGSMDIRIIRNDLKMLAMSSDMIINAMIKLMSKLLIK